jgi:acyl-CoA thioesterase-2
MVSLKYFTFANMKTVQELIQLLQLEKIEENIFRGQNLTVGSPHVFGGQVLGQALNAAYRTVGEGRFCHSLHAYFILPGNLDIPILYEVERTRDGGSFTTRNIKAIQNGKAIFSMIASFQLEQEGYNHQIEMPKNIATPNQLISWDEINEKFGEYLPKSYKYWLSIDRPIEFKPVEMSNPKEKKKLEPFKHVWMKAKGEEVLDKAMQHQILAYASDYNLLSAALNPHADVANISNIKMASLDHAMWFHRDFNIHEYLLYAIDSPSSSNSRGFTRGNIFDANGKLVASVAQEGLIRPINNAI